MSAVVDPCEEQREWNGPQKTSHHCLNPPRVDTREIQRGMPQSPRDTDENACGNRPIGRLQPWKSQAAPAGLLVQRSLEQQGLKISQEQTRNKLTTRVAAGQDRVEREAAR